MHRAALLEKLDAYTSFDQAEARMYTILERFVQANPRCFERSLDIGHITGSAWIVDMDKTHVLLTHHRKLDRWLQLGGHADGDPNILNVAWREAREESGLEQVKPASENIYDVDVHAIPASSKEPAHFHYDVRFLFTANRHTPLIISGESKDLAWVPVADIAKYSVDDSIMRMAHKMRRG
jgi:8-oxo-dGTP pyrophosphatase MutT (NUDIX family)